MTQETGETRNAILEDVQKRIELILSANKGRKGLYWLVLFAKPYKGNVEGKPTLVQHIKASSTKPPARVGVCVAEINNELGSIKWEINMPDKPFAFDALHLFGAKSCNEVVTETTSIPGSYLYSAAG